MMREAKHVAWLAGLLEGEGCFELKPKGARHPSARILVALQMNDEDVLEAALRVWPSTGSISKVNRKPYGKHQRARDVSNWGDSYRVYWYGYDAENLMRAVLPYMGKRRAAKIRKCLATPNLSHQKKAAA